MSTLKKPNIYPWSFEEILVSTIPHETTSKLCTLCQCEIKRNYYRTSHQGINEIPDMQLSCRDYYK